jgi:hypothetical protein
MSFIVIVSLIWGWLMKFFIYFSIAKEKLSERPINVLTIIDQVSKSSGCSKNLDL